MTQHPDHMGEPGNLPRSPRAVFVVHGRDLRLRDAIFDLLSALGLTPIEWEQAVALTGKAMPYVGEVLDVAFDHAQAVIVILSGDDEARLRPGLVSNEEPPFERNFTPQARPNVLFEAGMSLGRNPERTIIIEVGELRPFSDIAGRHTLRFRGTVEDRHILKERLKRAGCLVDDGGTRWLSAGAAVFPPVAERASRRRVLDLSRDNPKVFDDE